MASKGIVGKGEVVQGTLRRDEPLQVWNSGKNYLDYHRLKSYWFAEVTAALAPGDFESLVTNLPGPSLKYVKDAICVLVFVEGQAAEPLRLIDENARGYAIYSRETEGVRCCYFRRSGDASVFEHIEKLDAVGSSLLSSDEITMLHFASFDQVPDDSGICFFRKAVTEQEEAELRRMLKLPDRVQLDDAISGDPGMSAGVVYLQKPPVPESCGVPCKAGGGALFYCALEPWSGTRYCKLATETCPSNDLALALANQAPPGEVPDSARRLLSHLTTFRGLRDQALRESPGGRKYLGYYRLLSRYLKLDASMVKRLASIMPNIYKAVDALVYDAGDDVVIVQQALYDKAESILESLVSSDSQALRRVVADVRADLAAARGLTKAELSAYLGRASPGTRNQVR